MSFEKILLSCVDWSDVSEKKLPISFIDKYKEKIDWYILCKYGYITNTILTKYEKYIRWDAVISNPKLTTDMFLKHLDKFDLKDYNGNLDLPHSFYAEHASDLNWWSISQAKINDIDFLIELQDHILWDCVYFPADLNIDIVETFKEHIELDRLPKEVIAQLSDQLLLYFIRKSAK